MSCFLGIDGGGTRTTAWLADEDGRVLARAVTGPTNPLKVGFQATQRELSRAVRLALRRARLKISAPLSGKQRKRVAGKGRRPARLLLDAICVGLAGVDRPQVHGRLFAWLRRSIPARAHLLTSDAAIALRAAIGDSPGIIVVSGTGSIAYGRNDRGRVLRSGGWGVPFDDVGSGYDLGYRAIAAALRDYDGRGPYTQLSAKVCQALKIPDITRVVLLPLTPKEIAALFPLVLEAARRRDFVARELCEGAGRDLADLAVALLKRLGWLGRVVPVVCAGGVFRASVRIRRSFARHLRRAAPHARVLLLRHPPVEGALALARDLTDQA
ncbi:MAG: BadF/BadG/BcrA/BcrD ATPase family protein [Terriglobia bacterium]